MTSEDERAYHDARTDLDRVVVEATKSARNAIQRIAHLRAQIHLKLIQEWIKHYNGVLIPNMLDALYLPETKYRLGQATHSYYQYVFLYRLLNGLTPFRMFLEPEHRNMLRILNTIGDRLNVGSDWDPAP